MNERFRAYKLEINSHYVSGQWSAVHTERDPTGSITNGNHHVIAAVHHKILSLMDVWTETDRFRARRFIESTMDVTGVFNRAATKQEDQAHDDILAICVTSFYLNIPEYASDLERVGNRWTAGFMRVWGIKIPMMFKWYFDNTEETPEIQIKKWFGRFFWLPGIIRLAQNDRRKKMNLWHRLNYSVYMLWNAWFENDFTATSGRQLRWLTHDMVYRQGCPFTNWAIRTWRKKQEEIYGPPRIGDDLSGFNVPMGIFHGPTKGRSAIVFRHPFGRYLNDVWVLECRSTQSPKSFTLGG